MEPQRSTVNETIRACIDALAEAFVFADPGNCQALAQLHTHFETVEAWADDAGRPRLETIARRAANLIEALVLREIADPGAAFETIAECITGFQAVVCEGRDDKEVPFPPSLDPEERATTEDADATPTLPAHVDQEILTDFLARQGGVLHDLEQHLMAVESGNGSDDAAAVMRILHTLKGECGLLGLADVEHLCHRAEDACQADGVAAHVDALLAARDWLEQAFVFFEGNARSMEPVAGVLERLGGGETEEGAGNEMPEPIDLLSPQIETISQGAQSAIDNDPELVREFVSEAHEHLENADVNLLTLETRPRDAEALNTVFRAFHTIKGVASFLSLDDIRSLAHEAEDLLDAARKGNVELSGSVIDVTFDAVDTMKQLIDGLRGALETGKAPASAATLSQLIDSISLAAQGKVPERDVTPQTTSAVAGQPIGKILVQEGAAEAEAVEEALEKQKHGAQRQKLGALLVESGATSRRRIEDALHRQQEQHGNSGGPEKLGRILVESGDATTADVFNALNRQRQNVRPKRVGEILVRDGKAAAKDVARALRDQGAPAAAEEPEEQVAAPSQTVKAAPALRVREALKVDADRLDRLVDAIGELVIAESMVSQAPEVRGSDSEQLKGYVQQLGKITRELQEMATALRMVPLRSTFQRMARVVRDVAKKADKTIDFTMSGEDTELDKAVVDRIGDPLIHMVRNAVDHGIETSAEERTKTGKPPAGRISLRAYHKGGNIFVEIADDGGGLDRDAILMRARERGLLGANETLSDADVLNLIFAPGFSTAKTVTDVSGRGVGLDVVRKNIQLLRGEVEVQSEPGEGTTFIIRLPLTLAIIEGMVVHVGGERYILPALSMVTAVRPGNGDVVSVMNRGEMLRLQGALVPMFRLGQVLGAENADAAATESIAVVVEYEGKRAALMVDELVGRQQIVIKSLGQALCNIAGIAGGAVMPDGRVGLILDVPGLVRVATTGGAKLDSLQRDTQDPNLEEDSDTAAREV